MALLLSQATRLSRALLRVVPALLTVGLGPAGAEPSHDEYRVKAAFLLNFARLVQWPAAALPPSRPLAICVFGADPFESALEDAFEDKRVHSRDVAILQATSVDELSPCHLVFVGRSESERRGEVLERTRQKSVLLVGESEGFAAEGATINLFEEAGKIRFEVNLAAARAAGLRISARLLRLARIVGEDG